MSTQPEHAVVTTRPVHAEVALDRGPGRWRVGLIVLSSDLATERDFRRMSPGEDLQVHVSRVEQVNPCTVENLMRMAPRLTESARLILPGVGLDAVAYSCTSGTIVIGYEAVAASIRAAQPGTAVVTPITAVRAALESLGARRIALLTPYVDEVNQAMRGWLEDNGVIVASMHGFLMEDDNDMARIPPPAILEAVLQAGAVTPEADAVFVACTALRSADIIDEAERRLGKPVVTSIQAMFWQTIRAAGCDLPVTGYGRLLAEH